MSEIKKFKKALHCINWIFRFDDNNPYFTDKLKAAVIHDLEAIVHTITHHEKTIYEFEEHFYKISGKNESYANFITNLTNNLIPKVIKRLNRCDGELEISDTETRLAAAIYRLMVTIGEKPNYKPGD